MRLPTPNASHVLIAIFATIAIVDLILKWCH